MFFKVIAFLFILGICTACRREPSIYHSKADKSPGDNGVQIKISENPKSYIPGKLYALNLMASNPLDQSRRFKKFILTAEASDEAGNFSPQRVGNFQLLQSSLAKFNFECINTLKELNDSAKTEVFFMWNAPPPGSGCVTFKAMVLRDSLNWFADEGGLQKTICEQSEKDKMADPEECCACDEATYNLIFEGIWSSKTHPKDYPTLLWLTHFSDVIGASHERNFSFWGEGMIASEGFRSLAEWGSVRLMETELRAKSKYLRTIIKAAGLWYPSVNTNTSARFKVDRKHHLISLASMFGPTPDWVVGVSGLNLCLKNCTWQENAVIDLYPYDAGVDSGITYMSPNAETVPRERIYRITTTYPEDPRAPFYNPSESEIPPLARLYIKRNSVTPRNCDDNFLNAQLDISENSEDTSRVECAVTDYSNWSNCSVSCGKGLRMRSRVYREPEKAATANCNRQLVSKEMCVAAIPECPKGANKEDDLSIEAPLPEDTSGVCEVTDWENWSSCSVTCGLGFEMRTRHFTNKMGRKKCLHIPTVEKRKCMRPACVGGSAKVESEDSMCPTTEWSEWSPCSTSCGKGVRTRTRLLLVEPSLQQLCNSRIKMIEHAVCTEVPDCTLNTEAAKVVCLQENDVGECQGSFNRWYFDNRKFMCLPFIYSGCRGNKNNFITLEDCHQSCGVIKDFANGRLPTRTNSVGDFPSGASNMTTIGGPKIDCVVSKFSSWSPCSVTCGRGVTESTRTILTRPQNGGKVCPTRLVKRRRCAGPPC
ncbi:spondin-1 [Harmonia axyridis]|uniref:spondin-1 n=1 Tax=Harmonia axyridis TaxID=115357 RepID=UPI001E278340|nr:spondin-1 [Harmonia axyridis]